MAGPPPGIYDSFTERGLFWLPNKRDDEVPGTLTYDPEKGAVLELLGVFGELNDALAKAFGGARDDEEQVIHGVTTKGKPVSLLRAHDIHRQLPMPGIPHETWTSNQLVVGAHITSADDEAIFSKCYFRFEDIETWLEHAPFTNAVDNAARTVTVVAETPREVVFASHEEFTVSSVGSLYSNNKPATHYAVDVTSQLAITAKEPRSLNWHLNRAARLQELASLCSGHYLPLTAFELRGPDQELSGGKRRMGEVYLYAQLIHGSNGLIDRSKRRTPMLTGPELIRFSSNAVQLWFDQFDAFSPALRLFFTITAEHQMFTNIRLLLAIQALEVFHRRTSGDAVMTEDTFETFAQTMVAAIPADTSPAMREKLQTLYRFANEPTLKQRLRSIVTSLTEAFGERPGGFDSSFIRKLVDTRNYYTHFSEELRARTFDGEGMYWAARRVVLLLTLLFLQRLDINANDIKPLLKRHREFAKLWSEAKFPR